MPVKHKSPKKSMTVAELKVALKAKGLKVSGKKDDLKKRLVNANKKKRNTTISTNQSESSKYLRKLLNETTINLTSWNL